MVINLLVDPGADYLWLCRDDQSEGAKDQGVISDRSFSTCILCISYLKNLRVIMAPSSENSLSSFVVW